MMRGMVTDEREALIQLTICGARGTRRRIEAVLDTGYDGYLSLPPRLIGELKLPWLQRGNAERADGTETKFDVFRGAVIWDDHQRPIFIEEADTVPLVGMALMEGYELNLKVRPGGRVTISRLRG